MNPPWKEFPDYPRASMGWRMGGGQDFADRWRGWFIGLDTAARQRYVVDNPEPPGWEGFYEKLLQIYSKRN